MSIEEAWLYVKQKSDAIRSANDGQSIAKLKEESATSMYLPEISLSGSYTHLSKPIGTDTHSVAESISSALPLTSALMSALPNHQMDFSQQDIFIANLHALWPLYVGGKIDAMQDIYSAKSDEAKALLEMKKDEEFLKLVKYYYGVVVAKSLYETRKESQKALQLHYENAKKLKQQGQIANIELLNSQVKFDSAKIETTKAKHKYETALSALKSLVKVDIKPSSKLFIDEIKEDENYYKIKTQNNYKGLKILDAKERQSKAFIDIKQADYHPSVIGYANYNLYKDDSPIMKTLPQWFAGVMVKISLLQRTDRSQEIQVAKLLNSKVKHIKAQALEDLAILVEKTYRELSAYKEEYNALDSSVELAKENYKLRTIAFREGLSTSVEVIDAQMFLLGIKTKKLNVAYNYEKKLSQMYVLIGDRDMFFKDKIR